MHIKKKLKSLTVIETTISLLLVMIFLTFSFYSSFNLLKFISYRLTSAPIYNIQVQRLMSFINKNLKDIESAVDFRVDSNNILTYYKKDGASIFVNQVNLNDLLLQTTSSIVLTSTTYYDDVKRTKILSINLKIIDKYGNVQEARTLKKKLVSAVPFITNATVLSIQNMPMILNLYYPATHILNDTGDAFTSLTDIGLVHVSTPQDLFLDVILSYTLSDTATIFGENVYNKLYISISTTGTFIDYVDYALIPIPALKGADGSISTKYFLEVRR